MTIRKSCAAFPDEREFVEFEKLTEEIFRLMRKDLGLSDRAGRF